MTETRLLLVSALLASISQFHRSYVGSLGPELAVDLSLSARTLGAASGAFFLGIGASQFVVGTAIDKAGLARTLSILAVVTLLAVVWEAHAQGGLEFIGSRFVLGVGCSANLIAAFTLCARFLEPEKMSSRVSYVYAGGQLGVLLASAPLISAATLAGWRGALSASAAITAIVYGICIGLLPSSSAGRSGQTRVEPARLPGHAVRKLLLSRPYLAIFALNAVANASVITVLSLWAGPYVSAVHGLGASARGALIFAMGTTQLIGVLAYGQVDRYRVNRKKATVCGGMGASALLVLLAAFERLPTSAAIGALVLLPLIGSYSLLLIVHARELQPSEMLGRGIATINFAQVFGLVGLPLATGWIAGIGGDAAISGHGYRQVFGFMSLLLATAVSFYALALQSAVTVTKHE